MNYFVVKEFDSDDFILANDHLDNGFSLSEDLARCILTESEFKRVKNSYTVNISEKRVEQASKDYPEIFI